MTLTAFELAEEIKRAKVFRPSKPVLGCSEKDIAKIENRFGLRLPAAYKDFLRAMGRCQGEMMADVTISYPFIIKWHRHVVEAFEARKVPLPANRFVFLHRDGMFLFFDVQDGVEDPQICRFGECEVGDTLMNIMSFSEFLEDQVHRELEARKQLQESHARQSAERRTDKWFLEGWRKLSESPFQPGDTVRLLCDVSDRDANLGDGSLIKLEEGCELTIYQVYYFKDYSFLVEIVDRTGCKLLGLLDAREGMLELISSENRFLKSPTWEDFAY